MKKITPTAPVVRFKGFTDAWAQCKLFDCIQKITDFRGRTPKKLGMDWSESGYLALSALNVKDGYIDFEHDVHYGNQLLYDKWMSGNELHKGQVLFTTEAPMGNVAQVPDNRRYILSQRTIAFEVKKDMLTDDFLAAILKSPAVLSTLSALSSGGTAKGVSQKSLASVDVIIPIKLEEQKNLSTVFSSLTCLITLHQRKLDQLKKLKKYFLQNMFPAKGEKVPRIRFKGFTGDWEQRKLGDITTSFDYGLNVAAKKFDGENIYIRITDIDDESHKFVWSNVTSPDIDFNNADNYKLVEGDILFARTGASVGKSYIYQESDGIMYFAGFLIRARIKPEYDAKFVFQSTLTASYLKYIAITSQRSGQPGVNAHEYAEYTTMFPSVKEQKKIGEYLTSFDNLIVFYKHKIEKLQTLKKYMLQNMFI